MKNALAALAFLAVLSCTVLPAHANEYAANRTLDRVLPAAGANTVSVEGYNGEVRGSGGTVSIANGNGDITTQLAEGWHGSAIALHTNQGDVSLLVPRGFAATYTTHVLLGSIENRAPQRSGTVSVTTTVRFGDVTIAPE